MVPCASVRRASTSPPQVLDSLKHINRDQRLEVARPVEVVVSLDRLYWAAAAASGDELGGERDPCGVEGFVGDEAAQHLGGCRSCCGGVLVDGGEGRVEVSGDSDVSEAGEGQVGGDCEGAAICGSDNSDREEVAKGEDGGWGWVEIEELGSAFDAGFGGPVWDVCDVFGFEGE